jgi:hypothetical protein
MVTIDVLRKIDATVDDRTEAYAVELSCLLEELRWILDTFELFYDDIKIFNPSDSALALIRKKFWIARTDDDFCYRVYDYREKRFQFLNVALSVGLNEHEEKMRAKILDWLSQNDASRLVEQLDFFRKNNAVRRALTRRAALTHRRAIPDIDDLGRSQRFTEWLQWDSEGDLLEGKDSTDIGILSLYVDEHFKKTRDRLYDIHSDLNAFSNELASEILTTRVRHLSRRQSERA